MYKPLEYSELIAKIYPEDSNLCKTATLQVTDECNMACTYCYQINKGKNVMSFETAKKFVDLLLESHNNYFSADNSNGIILEFIGGEPLLQVSLIDQVIDYFQGRVIELNHPWAEKFMVSISSNGTLYFEPEVQEFLNKHQQHLSLSISLDGNKELHDKCRIFPDGRPTYDLVSSAAKDWMNKGNYIGSKITVCPENVTSLFEATKAMIELGYEELNANCVYEEGWTIEHAKILYKQLKEIADYILKRENRDNIYYSFFNEDWYQPMDLADNNNWCGGEGGITACEPQGNLYPCLRFMSSSLGESVEPLIIGNVDRGIGCTACERNCISCLKEITRTSQSEKECIDCPVANGCAWCTAYNYQVFGTPNKRATFICDMHRAASLANCYFWNKLYQEQKEDKTFKMYLSKEIALTIINEEEYNMLVQLSTNK
jgi:uncharacterized protein